MRNVPDYILKSHWCSALYLLATVSLPFNCWTNLLESSIKNAFTIKLCEVCQLLSLISPHIYLSNEVSRRTSSFHQVREGGGAPAVTRQTKERFVFSPATSRTPDWSTVAWLLSDSIRGLSGGSATTEIFKYFIIIIFTNIDKSQTFNQTFGNTNKKINK